MSRAPLYVWPGYITLLGGMCAFAFLLGNKNEVFTALIAGFLAYMASTERPHWFRAGMVGSLGMWFLYTIDLFRGESLSGLWDAVIHKVSEANEVGKFVSSSNEAFAAHFSMYGVLAARTPINFGYSFYSLACALVPRVLWPERPRDIYLYYTESVGTIQNQGYSLHHATGWYLNFGYAGVILGGIVLGLIWSMCLNAYGRYGGRPGVLLRLIAVVAPWTFVRQHPTAGSCGSRGLQGVHHRRRSHSGRCPALACRRAPREAKGSAARAERPCRSADPADFNNGSEAEKLVEATKIVSPTQRFKATELPDETISERHHPVPQ